MDGSLQSLLPMYEWARSNASPLVAATIVATRGSTYRKAGAQMLIAPDGCYDGVLSGGCLEGDIAGHAISVFETREPKMVQYQNEGDDDLLWGLGSGCEGGFDVWLTHLDPSTGWAPLGDLAGSLEQRVAAAYGLVLASSVSGLRPGMSFSSAKPVRNPGDVPQRVLDWIDRQLLDARSAPNARVVQFDEPQVSMFVASVQPAREVLLMGGGPDALPVVDLAGGLGWHVTVVDHRPAYVTDGRFPRARQVLLTTPAELSRAVDLSRFDAAVVMSHHLATDLAALDALANTPIPYVGLLGPSARSRRLLDDLGAAARLYGPRLRAPVGLKLGGRDPASIALAIVAEMQAFFHGKAAATSLGPQ
jgi:xanthine/CO dehydrogenase XdhC/CoxF family maturation factor